MEQKATLFPGTLQKACILLWLKITRAHQLWKTRSITVERIEKFTQSGQFSDVNLSSTLWKKQHADGIQIQVFSVPVLERISFDEAIKGPFEPTKVGESFGPTWSTHWFQLDFSIPTSMAGDSVLLIFDSSSEAMVWSSDGTPLIGLTGGNVNERHVDFRLTDNAKGGESFQFYVEVACNGLFGAGNGGLIEPPEINKYFKLEQVHLAVYNEHSYALHRDSEIFLGILKEFPQDCQLASDVLYTANKIVDAFRPDVPESLEVCRQMSVEFFKNHDMLGKSLHKITAIGNCHIDTAWLWPYDETKRKCARSWASQLRLIEQYPGYKFTASQAQQFEWVEKLYPKLFQNIKAKVKTGDFIPIGGTWVEMDCNLPSGESFCRQFLYGQRYFESRFGERCSVFWLPDTFGYSSQLPQITQQAGLKYFFTQKLSWNNINRFPHTTFNWTGLDGSTVLTHFSPADTYSAWASVHDVHYAVKNNKDKEYSNQSLLVYGYGDGGGGPTDKMLERLTRMQKVEGFPATVEFGSPNDFYKNLEASSKDLVTWRGELVN